MAMEICTVLNILIVMIFIDFRSRNAHTMTIIEAMCENCALQIHAVWYACLTILLNCD